MNVKLSELGDDCHLVINLNNMTASLLLDEDSQPYDEMKLSRTATKQWLWYWQHDDDSWRSYSEVLIIIVSVSYTHLTLPTKRIV